MKTQHRTCQSCGAAFALTSQDVAWYTAKGYKLPQRCGACRAARREKLRSLNRRTQRYHNPRECCKLQQLLDHQW